MKRKYNTLNEEVNRMKSLFGESRLYGNLVSNEKTNLITEAGPGKRFFAKNLAKAFSVTLKTFEDLGNFTKFLNREINSVDDMIKHVDDFPVIWKAIADKTDFAAVRRNLLLLKKMESKNLFKGRSKESMDIILDGFPPEGGMKDMVFDMWLVANGKSKNLPAVIDTRIAVIDPKSGELVIGKQNTETGVVVGINKNGEVVTVQNPKGEWKKGDDIIDMERTDIEGEFVDFEEIPNGTPLDDLNGKTVAGTEENVEAVLEATEKAAIEETKKGNKVVFTITGEGEDGVKAAQEMMDNITGGNSGTKTEVVDEIVEEVIKDSDEVIPPKEISKFRKYLVKILTEYPTKYFLNFPAAGEGRMRGFGDFSYNPNTKKMNVRPSDKAAQIGLYTAQVALRTIVIIPSTAFLSYTLYKDVKYDRNILTGVMIDFTIISKKILDWSKDLSVSEPFLDGLKGSIEVATDGAVDVDIVINNMTTAATLAIENAQSGDSHISCTDLLTKSDDEIIKMSFSEIKREEKARVAEILQEKFGGPGLEIDKINKIKSDVNSVMDFVINQGLIDSEKSGLGTAVQQMREKCRLEKEGQSELDEYSSKDYTVKVDSTMTGGGY